MSGQGTRQRRVPKLKPPCHARAMAGARARERRIRSLQQCALTVISGKSRKVAHDAEALDRPAALEQQDGALELRHVVVDHERLDVLGRLAWAHSRSGSME